VRDLLSHGSLEYEADDVSILTGSQEGYYMWVCFELKKENEKVLRTLYIEMIFKFYN
jgi:hypothetical protein